VLIASDARVFVETEIRHGRTEYESIARSQPKECGFTPNSAGAQHAAIRVVAIGPEDDLALEPIQNLRHDPSEGGDQDHIKPAIDLIP
jgi:hypothetical protein